MTARSKLRGHLEKAQDYVFQTSLHQYAHHLPLVTLTRKITHRHRHDQPKAQGLRLSNAGSCSSGTTGIGLQIRLPPRCRLDSLQLCLMDLPPPGVDPDSPLNTGFAV